MFGEIYELVTRWRIGRRNLLAPLRMRRKQRGVRLEMAVGRKTEFRSIRKTQKYTGVGPREFVQYDDEELATEGIKAACEKNFFSPSLQRKGFSCDFLAGEQWPSFYSMKRIPDLKVIHVRLIKSSSSSDRPMKDDCVSSSSGQPCVSEPVTPP